MDASLEIPATVYADVIKLFGAAQAVYKGEKDQADAMAQYLVSLMGDSYTTGKVTGAEPDGVVSTMIYGRPTAYRCIVAAPVPSASVPSRRDNPGPLYAVEPVSSSVDAPVLLLWRSRITERSTHSALQRETLTRRSGSPPRRRPRSKGRKRLATANPAVSPDHRLRAPTARHVRLTHQIFTWIIGLTLYSHLTGDLAFRGRPWKTTVELCHPGQAHLQVNPLFFHPFFPDRTLTNPRRLAQQSPAENAHSVSERPPDTDPASRRRLSSSAQPSTDQRTIRH
jgi:hypothetical protein